MKSLFAVLPLILAASAAGQTLQHRDEIRREKAAGITNLSGQLRFRDAADAERYKRLRNEVTARVQSSVDDYITAVYRNERRDPRQVQQDLEDLLQSSRYDPEYSGPPFAAVDSAGGIPSLVVGYMIVRGGSAVNDSAVTIRGYVDKGQGIELAASTGSDFDGYGLFIQSLESPVPAQQWILAWGPLSGFNGRKVRIRLYSFDGQKFETKWEPDDALNATISVSGGTITVTRLDEERYYVTFKPPYTLREEYTIVPSGIMKRTSH